MVRYFNLPFIMVNAYFYLSIYNTCLWKSFFTERSEEAQI